MSTDSTHLSEIPGLRRFENFPKDDMNGLAMELTHAVYPHEQMFGQYCTLEEYIDCPPDEVYAYLADPYTLGEWTYSMRDFGEMDAEGRVRSTDKIGGETHIYTKVDANPQARTVDFHCAWDQGDTLWMIYLMRVVPAKRVFNKPGSVVLWTNCHHPFYDENPFPEAAPKDRPVWVGDLWPFFYAGHWVEMQNLKCILEYRHKHSLPINPGAARRVAA